MNPHKIKEKRSFVCPFISLSKHSFRQMEIEIFRPTLVGLFFFHSSVGYDMPASVRMEKHWHPSEERLYFYSETTKQNHRCLLKKDRLSTYPSSGGFLCSTEHGKVSFEPLEINSAAKSSLPLQGGWQPSEVGFPV